MKYSCFFRNLRFLAIFCIVLLFDNQYLNAQQSCCNSVATEDFASFTKEKNFVDAHQLPNMAPYTSPKGKEISFATEGGKDGKAYLVESSTEAGKKAKKYVFVFHEWWGLNDNTKREADELAKSMPDVNVMAIDLYDGVRASTREEAAKAMSENKAERSIQIIKGASAYAGKKAQIATMGWCFGGGWSLQATLALGKKAKACVMYYGMPESDVEKLKKLNCAVLFVHASKDQWITDKVVGDFEKNMATAAKKLTVVRYDADHAFANPSNTDRYKKDFANEAFGKSVDFISMGLGLKK